MFPVFNTGAVLFLTSCETMERGVKFGTQTLRLVEYISTT